jgi:integrase
MIIGNLISPLSEYFYEFVRMKRSLGYRYDSDKLYWLRAIDKICAEYVGDGLGLSKQATETWALQRQGESLRNQQNRIRFSNELAEFLLCRNIKAHLLPAKKTRFSSASSFVPYVFTHEQIQKFFQAADAHPPHRNHPISNHMYSFLFRLLYCCVLRISEALALRYNSIDLTTGVLESVYHLFKESHLAYNYFQNS